jgi:hypothetical protein
MSIICVLPVHQPAGEVSWPSAAGWPQNRLLPNLEFAELDRMDNDARRHARLQIMQYAYLGAD